MFSYTQHTGETIADIFMVGDPILCCIRSVEVAAAPIPSESSKSIGSRKIKCISSQRHLMCTRYSSFNLCQAYQ
jgi:hypothetical protein